MTSVALKGLLGRKARATLTAIAVVLGVAMVSGTYILTDTIKSAFSTVFTHVYKNTDAVITGKSAVAGEEGGEERALAPSFSASLLRQVQALPGVAQASGGISDRAQLVGHNGKVISRGGAPALAFSYQPGAERFNPLSLTSGNWPSGPDQVAIDASTASKEGFKVGQRIGVIARGPEQYFTIAGTVKFGGLSSLGGATMSVFTTATAQQIFNKQGRFDTVQVAAKSGVSPQQLLGEIRPLLPRGAQVRTGQAQARKQTNNTNGFLNIFKDFLLAFGGVALFVGSFVIANTLSITIAQRTRELATLRTLGATRRQVLRSVMLEALVIGLVASLAGLFLGLALAKGLNSLLVSFGIDLPQASTVFATRTIIVSLLVGVLITLLAALRPALRSTRVPPIAAVREGAVLPPTRFARLGVYPALATVAGALALMLLGVFSGLSTGTRLLAIGVGVVSLFLGVAMLAPRLVPPLARVLGWPAQRLGGAAGSLARANSMRNPARTASTASALMIGLALVTFVGVLAAGLRTRFESSVNEVFVANYALTASNNFSPISISSANALASVPGVEVVSGVRAGDGRAFGSRINVTGVSPDVGRVISTKWQAGGPQTPALLGSDGVFVSKDYAKEHHLGVGSPISLEVPSGARLPLTVRGIYKPPEGGPRSTATCPSPRRALTRSTAIPRACIRSSTCAAASRAPTRASSRLRSGASPTPSCRPSPSSSTPAAGPEPAAEPALRAAVAVDRREPVRDRQHARADGVRAHARARHAARRGHDAPPGAAHDPPRERDHGAARRGVRHPGRHRAFAACWDRDQIRGVYGAGGHAGGVRGRGDLRRDRGRDLPSAPRRAARRAEGVAVRVSAATRRRPTLCARRRGGEQARQERSQAAVALDGAMLVCSSLWTAMMAGSPGSMPTSLRMGIRVSPKASNASGDSQTW
jgi:putative ABC transport system permease protein